LRRFVIAVFVGIANSVNLALTRKMEIWLLWPRGVIMKSVAAIVTKNMR
jgi:hypothetical protein